MPYAFCLCLYALNRVYETPIAVSLELSAKDERHTNFLDLAYAECVERAGGLPLYFPSLPSPAFAAEAVAMIDGLVLTGGADIHPFYYGE